MIEQGQKKKHTDTELCFFFSTGVQMKQSLSLSGIETIWHQITQYLSLYDLEIMMCVNQRWSGYVTTHPSLVKRRLRLVQHLTLINKIHWIPSMQMSEKHIHAVTQKIQNNQRVFFFPLSSFFM